MPGRVVLAMSGGVDSSVAAYLLKQQGYEVVGLFMRTGVHSDATDTRADHKKGCCSAVDAGDARRVADRLDIPFYALDFEHDFDRIIDYFADEYLRGRTPNPCVVCNTWLKFGKLWAYGKQLEADFIATGHYARIVAEAGQHELHTAADPDKDQSYVLYGIRREILPHLLFPDRRFPQGRGPVDRARGRAGRRRQAGQRRDLLRARRRPRPADPPPAARARRRPASFVDTAGKVLAEHDGIERFTIGQRKGLGFAAGQRRYVLEIVPETNEVVVGDREELLAVACVASQVNWLTDAPPAPLACEAKIRYRHAAAPATVTALPDGGATRGRSPSRRRR